jgi:hypothetical protein
LSWHVTLDYWNRTAKPKHDLETKNTGSGEDRSLL